MSQLESESTHGKGKLGLQASLTLMKKSNTKASFAYIVTTLYASSVLYNHTHAKSQTQSGTHSGGREMKSVKEEKPKPYIYAIKS